jgi:flagellar biosynthetic protein FlhB
MSESTSSDRSFDPTDRRLQQARERGDVVSVREGPAAGVYLAALIGLLLLGGPIAHRIGEIVMPLLDQPDAFLDLTEAGWGAAGHAVAMAVALAIAPFFALVAAGALLPHLLQNSIAISAERIMPKGSHLSPRSGFKRIFGLRSVFEFAKNLAKMGTVGVVCYIVARPLYDRSVGFVSIDIEQMPAMLQQSLLAILLVATLVAVVIAAVDMPYQQWAYRRRMRMTLQELRDEMRESEGDPRMKARRRALRRKRFHRRMMQEVPKATVIITNPTHFAVALRYERGKDAAPVVVAKGVELIALRIRETARQHRVAIIEDPPLARALHAAAEIGDVIPREHFEAVAKIIGLVWAQRGLARQAPAA